MEYTSVIRLIEYLLHRNSDCARTIVNYLGVLGATLKVLNNITADDLVRVAKEASDDQFEALFLGLDAHWLSEQNSEASRKTKWAALKTFMVANGVRKAYPLKCNIKKKKRTVDYPLNREECRKILDTAKSTEDKLIISLLIESLQRIGTLCLLRWGDVQQHLSKGEDVFLIWIDAARTKCSVDHWMPVGPLSAYYLRKRLSELGEVDSEDRIVSCTRAAAIMQIRRVMTQAGVLGRKQGQGRMTRYEHHVHSFRKMGKHEMGKLMAKANPDVIEYLMGHRCDAYTEWGDKYDELLAIYREAKPTLDQRDAVMDITDYAHSRGYSLDPKQGFAFADSQGISELVQALTKAMIDELKWQKALGS